MYGVKVNLICQSYDSTHEKITTTWTGGGDADVCYVDIPWVAEFESKGVTIDLSDYMDEDVKNSLIESSLNQMVYNEKTEAIPFANGGKWMFYNKQMLADAGYEEPPKTWDELKEMSQDMIDKGICKYGIAWGASQAEGLICDLTTMIYSFGGTWQKEDASFDINSESANDAVQFMYDSMQEGWADPASITYTDRDCLDPFMAGDTAFVMNWAYVYGYANNPENSTVAGNVDICLMPGTDKAESASVTGGGEYCLRQNIQIMHINILSYSLMKIFRNMHMRIIMCYRQLMHYIKMRIWWLNMKSWLSFIHSLQQHIQDRSLLITVNGLIRYSHYSQQHYQGQLQLKMH